MEALMYNHCQSCMKVKLDMTMSCQRPNTTCMRCHQKQYECSNFQHPIWIDDNQSVHFTVHEELSSLTEGEKLLIQQVSPYVPLQHLHNGLYGSKGHVCSFPQNIHNVCTILPRLPANIDSRSVVKTFMTEEGETKKISFKI